MDMDEDIDEQEQKVVKTSFKTPVLFGKIGRFPHKVFNKSTENLQTVPTSTKDTKVTDKLINPEPVAETPVRSAQPQRDSENIAVPYKEPSWSGLPDTPDRDYAFDILKSGVIIERLNVMSKPYWVFGRLQNSDIIMAHPTISRHHAVLQFRKEKDEVNDPGFYLYDLDSTHGTFLNKCRLKPRVYARVQVGHMIKFGCSTRSYILDGPIEDTEEESELSVTELKAKRAEELLRREEAAKAAKEQEELRLLEEKKKEEERGISWGIAEDADDETDLAENPYAQTNNEDLYVDDPKKTLRGYMEREGLQLEYDCNERGVGQFHCRVELPVDDERGRPIVAEVLHKGKKKEAVVQCALEACRILDRYGLLRQATQESRKRKTKDWAENDFYDSDDDTFLDRTGAVERKRQSRMQKKVPQQAETYQGLLEKESSISTEINRIEAELARARREAEAKKGDPTEEDSLESYMKDLKKEKTLDKQTISRYKSELITLKQEHAKVLKLVNIARPADLPPLVAQYIQNKDSSGARRLPMFGKRLKVKVEIPKPKPITMEDDDDEEDELADQKNDNTSTSGKLPITDDKTNISTSISENLSIDENIEDTKTNSPETSIENVISNDKSNPDLMEINEVISEKTGTSKTKDSIASEINEYDLPSVSHVDTSSNTNKSDSIDKDKVLSDAEVEKRRKKNERRLQQRQEKLENERLRGYEEDSKKVDYNMWVPPSGQTGDGRTSLNDKFGY